MPDSEPSIRQIEAFRALMQTRTATRAAAALGVSQPAVSRLLADFEAGVGFALFERRNGRLWPTAHAHALHEEVERAFTGFERVIQAAARWRRRVRCGSNRSASGRCAASCRAVIGLRASER